jgi:TonB family protein
MSHESGQVSGSELGVLKGCLVEGDPERQMRQRKLRRRALVFSVALQSLGLAVIVLVPLLGKPARIALANVTPVPPYYSRPAARPITVEPQPRRPENTCRFCPGRTIPPNIMLHDAPRPDDGQGEPRFDGIEIPGAMAPPPDSRSTTVPTPPRTEVERPRVVHVTHIDPAMLVHRVEPVYPTLAKQIGRSGKVELRAIIATDGTIQSLEAVGGDPIFFPSALEAVRQWRYTPTLLNGQQVQVDTYITVIYNLQR